MPLPLLSRLRAFCLPFVSVAALVLAAGTLSRPAGAQQRHNVILFVADGLRRGSVTAEDTPALWKLRGEGVDFRNSHAVFPTFTTANASVIATGHGLGDTGDYGNFIYPGVWLAKPDPAAALGSVAPFLENDEVLADMNGLFDGNYLGERTLLSVAREHGFHVASVGKLGPAAIQQNESLRWSQLGFLNGNGAIVVDDSTGKPNGVPLPPEILEALEKAGLAQESPLRSNGYSENSIANNGFSGDAVTPGTNAANRVQEQWFADVSTKVLLPRFAASPEPFVLLFWSRDPDGTQHNEGDSLQALGPGINGNTSRLGLQNADHCLQQLLDWLDANPEVKARTDVVITSDHGFATMSRREIAGDGQTSTEPSAILLYEPSGKDKPQPQGSLPQGFLAIDLAIRGHMRLYDAAVRATEGASVYAEVPLAGEKSHYPSTGSALLGETIKNVDGSDARLIVTANGGSDLIYVPGRDAKVVRDTVEILAERDYVDGIFVDDAFCPTAADCPGALPMSAIGLAGHSHVPRPAIVVTFKDFNRTPGDLQSGVQVSDYPLQEGQGMHGGFGRDQTLNNMTAWGPDFKKNFVDEAPAGNIDIVPTLAKLMGVEMPSVGTLKGRVLEEALRDGASLPAASVRTTASAPTSNGVRTLLEYEEVNGFRYDDRACLVSGKATRCP